MVLVSGNDLSSTSLTKNFSIYVISEAGTLKCGAPESSILFINQKLAPISMEMILVLSTSLRLFKKFKLF